MDSDLWFSQKKGIYNIYITIYNCTPSEDNTSHNRYLIQIIVRFEAGRDDEENNGSKEMPFNFYYPEKIKNYQV
ncbi:MAG: hypothetical protein EU532_00700 [Promethearchaeota archaeon]|nr:MAG: hypothetical protein EU532_00700 [Candidatus Lokiarchaeota archaeon]